MPSDGQAVNPRAFRTALGAFPTGVTIVTTHTEAGEDVGLTVNSFNSVSLDPPLVLWSLSANSSSRAAFTNADYFAIHILSAQQQELAARFARKDIDRFAGLEIARGQGQTPLIDGCSARFVCRRAHQYEGGDHIIIVGEVVALERFDRPPLAFHSGKYALALPKGAPPPAPIMADARSEHVDPNAVNMLIGLAHTYIAQRLAPHLAARNMSEPDYWVLSIIGAKEGRTVSRLTEMLAYSGLCVDLAQVRRLEGLGYVALRATDGDAGVWLTDLGRRELMEMAARSKAVEMTLERGLDYAEAQLLWELLRRLIVSMIPAKPA